MIQRRQKSLELLAKLAEHKEKAALQKLAEVQKAHERLAEKSRQVADLMADYRAQLTNIGEDPGMVKTQAVHRYIRNLLDAQERLRVEHDKTVAWERAVREELMNARLELLEKVIAARSAASPLALANALRSFSTGRQPSLWGALSSLRPPTLLLVGDLDHKYTEIAERMVDGNPGIARMVVSGCGHNVHLEAPETYTTVLRHFLAG